MRVCELRLRALLGFYLARVRQNPVQEMLAGAGIAVGVALVYAVLVSTSSITGAAAQVVDGIAGRASLQLTARSDGGFSERLAERAERVAGVRRAVPLLRSNVTLVGPRGRRSVQLLGSTPELATLGGKLTRNFGPAGLRLAGGVAIPEGVAESVGGSSGGALQLRADGAKRRVPIVVLSDEVLGSLASTGSALAPLSLAQEISRRSGRLSHVLVETEPGQGDRVRRGLERIAGNRVDVSGADAELAALRQAAKPNEQSTRLFAVVGFLLSLNAMLFTVAERRRFVAALRLEGASPRQALAVIVFEAVALGAMASMVGLALGEVLLRLLFGDAPDYLTFAFPVGTERIVTPSIVGLALGGGMLAVLLVSLRPALDLRSGVSLDAVNRDRTEPGEAIGAGAARRLLWLAVGLLALTTAIAVAVPAATVIGGVTLVIVVLLVIPATFSAVTDRLGRLARSTRRLNMLAVALMELRATNTRSVALTAVAALAVYGSVAIGGARQDIVRGLDSHTRQWLSNADVWVTTGGQDLMTNSFTAPSGLARLRQAAGVEAVRLHRGGFLNIDGRRIWLIGRPAGDRTMIPASQMLEGDIELATARLRSGGWATASAAVAEERGIEIGDRFSFPTPTGDATFRLAATTMNFGWIPGSITINGREYVDAMGTAAPSAIEVDLAPRVAAAEGKRMVSRALGPEAGLTVQTRGERELQYYEFGREGVARLDQLARLLLLAAALTIPFALAATLWRRRPPLASLKVQGARRMQLWLAMLFETGLLVTVGCVVGAILGIYGQLLAGRFVREATGFAAPFTVEPGQLLMAVGLVVGVALAASAVPGYVAATVPARASFRE
ncbi:MAG: FtsX-like permease family protein [Thermoleophilaceae bacterium]